MNLQFWLWFALVCSLGCLLTGLDIGKNRSRVLLWLWDKIKWPWKNRTRKVVWIPISLLGVAMLLKLFGQHYYLLAGYSAFAFLASCWWSDWKKIGPVWMQKTWQQVWGKTKKYSTAAWNHRTEKKVWVPFAALVGILLLVFLGKPAFLGFQMPSTPRIPGVSAGMRSWAFRIIIGVIFLIGEIVLWASVRQGTIAGKTVWKIHGWVLGGVAVIFGVIKLLSFISWTETFKWYGNGIGKGFEWLLKTVPHPFATTLGIVCVLIGIVVWARKKFSLPTIKFAWGTFFLWLLALGAVWTALLYFAPDFVKKCWSGFGWPIAFKTGEYFWLTLIIHAIIFLLIVKGCGGEKAAADTKKKGEGLKKTKEVCDLLLLLGKFAVVILLGVLIFIGIVGRENITTSAAISTGQRNPEKDPVMAYTGVETPVYGEWGKGTDIEVLRENATVRVRIGEELFYKTNGSPNIPKTSGSVMFVTSAETFAVPIKVIRKDAR